MYQPYQIATIAGRLTQNQFTDCRKIQFNTGGPSSRTRKERIQTTILDNKKGSIWCPSVIHLGLNFGDQSPVHTIENILKEEGFHDPEDLRKKFMTITAMHICQVAINPKPLIVGKASRKSVLHQAVLLGLCTATFFDPTRPIIWTTTSLTRCLDLYNMTGFYL